MLSTPNARHASSSDQTSNQLQPINSNPMLSKVAPLTDSRQVHAGQKEIVRAGEFNQFEVVGSMWTNSVMPSTLKGQTHEGKPAHKDGVHPDAMTNTKSSE